ncbi:unnamed protein product [Diplocarpon coronariae]|uniref:C-type lectin domain-containing protein n=1 Tax=Diplocarpon coronariae TaxID=2795749 RepID=A0A218ZGI9_9HELO|nr:hypothetical protein JHW43_002942 [Diplocarpon mali]OWP06673.1 C-type lectin domain-containing protein [Marssonina coronariae]
MATSGSRSESQKRAFTLELHTQLTHQYSLATPYSAVPPDYSTSTQEPQRGEYGRFEDMAIIQSAVDAMAEAKAQKLRSAPPVNGSNAVGGKSGDGHLEKRGDSMTEARHSANSAAGPYSPGVPASSFEGLTLTSDADLNPHFGPVWWPMEWSSADNTRPDPFGTIRLARRRAISNTGPSPFGPIARPRRSE